MKWLLVIAFPALLASCADKPFATVPPPPRAKAVDVKPAREAVIRASEENTKSRENAAKAEVQLDQVAKSVTNADALAGEAFEKGMAAESELADRIKTSIKQIAIELSDARRTITDLRVSLQKSSAELETAKGSIADVQADAAAKEHETVTALSNLSHANSRLEKSEQNRTAQEKRATTETTLKRLWRTAALVEGAILLLVIIWKVYRLRIPRIV